MFCLVFFSSIFFVNKLVGILHVNPICLLEGTLIDKISCYTFMDKYWNNNTSLNILFLTKFALILS